MQADVEMFVAEGALRGAQLFWALVDLSCGRIAAVAFPTDRRWTCLDGTGQHESTVGFWMATCLHCSRAIRLGGKDRHCAPYYKQSADDVIAMAQRGHLSAAAAARWV